VSEATVEAIKVIALAAIAGIPPTIMAFVAYKSSKGNREDIAENTRVTKDLKEDTRVAFKAQSLDTAAVHTLVNDISTQGLGTLATALERLADLSGHPSDRYAAVDARTRFNRKVQVDQDVSSQIREGNAAAAEAREIRQEQEQEQEQEQKQNQKEQGS